MPRRDGTGPMGAGPMTGRGLGLCTGANAVRLVTRLGMGLGLGLAYRRGLGRGFGLGIGRTEKQSLQEQKEMLENQLEVIDQQLDNL